MGNVKDLVIGRMIRLFGLPNTIAEAELPAFFREYHDSLSGFDDALLTKAMNWVRDNHDTTFWPPPGVINQACRKYIPSQPVESKNWNDMDFTPKDAASRERVRQMAQAFRANMGVKQMPREGFSDYTRLDERIDVSRPAMERKEKEWREAERKQLTELSKRMTGEAS